MVLTPSGPGKADCPFYASRAEHFDSCARAYVSLKNNEGGENYIERYANTLQRVGSGQKAGAVKCNKAYLSLFEKAAPGSYAGSVYAEYAPQYET